MKGINKMINKPCLVFLASIFISLGATNANVILVDSFNSGNVHITDNNGSTDFNTFSDPSIIGGKRQLRVRDAWTFHGPVHQSVANGHLNVWKDGNPAADWRVYYGTAISDPFPFSPNPDTGSDLNLALGLASTLDIDVAENPNGFQLTFYTGFGNATFSDTLTTGLNSYSLTTMGLTADQASDIKGLAFSFAGDFTYANAQRIDNISFTAAAVPEPSTYALMLLGLVGLGVYRKRRK